MDRPWKIARGGIARGGIARGGIARGGIALGTTVFAMLAGGGCASTGDSDSAGKVWMRDGSTYGAEQAIQRCQPASLTQTDFRLCMQGDGYSLETPPAP